MKYSGWMARTIFSLTVLVALAPAAPVLADHSSSNKAIPEKPDVQMPISGGGQYSSYDRARRELEQLVVTLDHDRENRGDPKTDWDQSENRHHSDEHSQGPLHANPHSPIAAPVVSEPEPFVPPVDPLAVSIHIVDWRTSGSTYNSDKNRVVTYLPKTSGDYKKLQLVYQGYSNTLLYAVATVETQLTEPPDLRGFELQTSTITSTGQTVETYTYPGLDGVTLKLTYDLSGALLSTTVTQVMILSPDQIVF